MIGAGLFLAVLAGVLVFMGRRGRRVDTHPVCRACGFDLLYLPEGSSRCSECGANVRRAGAVRTGNRLSRPSIVGAGWVLAVAGIGICGWGGSRWMLRQDFNAFKPMSTLQREMGSTDLGVRRRACAEVLRRIRGGAGPDRQIAAAVDSLLARQASVGDAWWAPWGDVVQAAESRGRISQATWERYVDQAMDVEPVVRAKIARDDPLPIGLTCEFHGGTDVGPLAGAVLTPSLALEADGEHTQITLQPAVEDIVPMPVKWGTAWIRKAPAARREGSHVVRLVARLTVTMQAHGKAEKMVIVRRATLATQVLPPGVMSVEGVNGSGRGHMAGGSLRAAVRRAVRYETGDNTVSDAGAAKGDRPGRLGVLTITNPPMPVAFEVILRQGSKEWVLTRMLARPNHFVRAPLAARASGYPPHTGRAELLLEPDYALAGETVDVMRIWGGWVEVPIVLGDATPTR